MKHQADELSERQQQFFKTFLMLAGSAAIGKKFYLSRHDDRRYARWEQVEIPLNQIADEELLRLARSGYLIVYCQTPAIIFTEKVLAALPPDEEAVSEISSIRQQLRRRQGNLLKLKEQAAIYGAGETPLRLLNQIEAEEEAIANLEEKLQALKGQGDG